MKHKKIGFLHLMCGKQGQKGKRKLSFETSFQSTDEAYLFGVSVRLIFFFFGFAIEIEKKQEEKPKNDQTVSQETSDNDSV